MLRRLRFAGLLLAMLTATAMATAPGGSAVLLAGQTSQVAAQPTPTFRSGVEYVEVDAVVTDAQGQFVRGLTKDDFQVSEDGKRQTVAELTLVDIPIEKYRPPALREPAD